MIQISEKPHINVSPRISRLFVNERAIILLAFVFRSNQVDTGIPETRSGILLSILEHVNSSNCTAQIFLLCGRFSQAHENSEVFGEQYYQRAILLRHVCGAESSQILSIPGRERRCSQCN